MRKKIAIVTATRAEYGLFKPILKAIEKDNDLEYYLIITGLHLSQEFGYTINEIIEDGLCISARIDVLHKEDTGFGMAKYIGELIIELSKEFDKSNPDILLLLGDRGEMLAAAIAAVSMNIAVAHLHGGELSGSIDDLFRHAITKLAHIHLLATETTKNRIIRIGEDPKRIFVVGAPGLDDIDEGLLTPNNISEKYNLDLSRPIILFVQHAVTTETDDSKYQIKETLDAITEMNYQTVIIYPNADPGGRRMINVIEEYAKAHNFIKTYKSLPRRDYLSIMNVASVMVGNSSSGIIESPSFKLPVVNVGTRQKGRERADNVIDVDYNRKKIKTAIENAIYNEEFKKKLKGCRNPYGDGKAAPRILKILKEIKVDSSLLQKR